MRLTSPRWARAKGSLDVLTGDYKDTRRVQIINSSLCNDIIQLLRPSLPRPGTCDIIDINPGQCSWSKALHEALQPRRHVLVEPQGSKYQDTIASLANEPGSRYRSVSTIAEATELDNLSDAFRRQYEGLDEEQRRKARYKPNDELIITANLSGKKKTTTRFSGPPWAIFLDHFYRSIVANAGIQDLHKYGLVRLFAWIPESDKDKIVPKTILRRSRISKKIEAAFNVREVVSKDYHTKPETVPQAWHDATVESANRTSIRQEVNKLHIPPHRRHSLPLAPIRSFAPTPENLGIYETTPTKSKLVRTFVQLWRDLEAEDAPWLAEHVSLMNGERQRRRGLLPAEPIYHDFCWAYTRMRLFHNKYKYAKDMVNKIVALEQELVSFRKQHPEDFEGYLKLVEQVDPKLKSLSIHRIEAYKDTGIEVLKAIDDFRAVYHDPPVLCWHNRPHEPLRSHPKEDFQPSREPLCLIEVTPKTSYSDAINTSDRQIMFDYVCNCFDSIAVPITSVKTALENLVGAGELYESFIQTIPSLTDPLYGGWHDLSDVRTRTISGEALIQITLAYEAWPYRMSTMKLLEITKGLARGFLEDGPRKGPRH